ncbi:DUF2017 family protein [Clavibacter michiganensis]|uniref:Uncharacterized protein n=3 Tax=Clavibacter michiganensis subsp. insidiosus TaxID=33014 RepID=A0A0D5CH59_9MICO|nr:DUF2017 family protein [Clavibacter michiganensis]AJW78619.1 hypothetical protein VO01_05290 [Clavibacter michiganensis subsp. insidiosus]AWF98728.1 hypothetical protein BEH61_09445 [Clavibacter michiganensis subsp. insidiosus]AWG01054.1 hypothetical protein BEH62_05530 [Clavibacter michiganensis subsp. insidiosus]OQJ60378.1 hypothetical protein B5P21_10985 [Clavibacter michiganensis subsp. insidiosus]RII87403.1 DUF2017 family protein [Clavibacter michiganensis subsp. insidiosus]
MRAFRARPDGTVAAHLEPHEVAMLRGLLGELRGILDEGSAPGGAADGAAPSPVVERLLPDAYPDDAESSAEFRRFTASDLTEAKAANATAVEATLAEADARGAGRRGLLVVLDPTGAQAWLRTLNDLRLAISVPLRIDEADGWRDRAPEESASLYDWLTFAQGSLIEAVDR